MKNVNHLPLSDEIVRNIARAIRRIIVDDKDIEVQPLRVNRVDEGNKIISFIVCRDNDNTRTINSIAHSVSYVGQGYTVLCGNP